MTRRRYRIVGDGPAGLYLAIELARADARAEVTIHADRRPLGAGVVLDADFVELLQLRDPVSGGRIRQACEVWDSVRIVVGGREIITGGHVIHAVSRAALVGILRERASQLGARFVSGGDGAAVLAESCDVVIGADGASSTTRSMDAAQFGEQITESGSVYLWMCADAPLLPGFWVAEVSGGAVVAHVYPYAAGHSALVIECSPIVARSAGIWDVERAETERRVTEIFAEELRGAIVQAVTLRWEHFRTVRTKHWFSGRSVLVGDAAHTTHYSVGSGTRLAVEDAIALADALTTEPDIEKALVAFESARKPIIADKQVDADSSQIWFEDIGRHMKLPADQFAFALRSRRQVNTFGWLARRDPGFVGRVLQAVVADRRCPLDSPVGLDFPAGMAKPRLLPLRLGARIVDGRIFDADSGVAGRGSQADAGFGVLGRPGYVVIPIGDEGHRVERTRTAERLRNEYGHTVLLQVPAISEDEADTLIASGRIDGCVVGR